MTSVRQAGCGPLARILDAGAQRLVSLWRDESGVALVMTLACFMFMYVMCMGVYAVGTAVREKIQLQNAADAAAYSAAVIQADTISRIATINRAMAWTYVQMTRRQMDFIVHKWLERTAEIYDEDLALARKWNLLSICIPGNCSQIHRGGGPRSDTFWCGIDESRVGQIWVNGLAPDFDDVPIIGSVAETARNIPLMDKVGLGRALDMTEIKRRISAFSSQYTTLSLPFSGDYITMLQGDLGMQILLDKANIAAMNLAEAHLVFALKGRIENVVPDILKANIPEYDVDGDKVVYRLDQASSH